ncbi:hypothetical protein Bhyg_15129, partial [Pseudolycoriella hygida]
HVPIADGYTSSRNDSIESESDSSVTSKSPNNWNQDTILEEIMSTARAVPDPKSQSLNNNYISRNSPCSVNMGRSPNEHNYHSFMKRSTPRKSIDRCGSPSLSGYPNAVRRGSLDHYGSPPSNAYFPHDLDDIYEYKTDHQYFTHTGNYNQQKSINRTSLNSDAHRQQFFHRTPAARSLDDDNPLHARYADKNRFDNSSFIRSLNDSETSINQSPKEKSSKSSLHGMFKTIGKKAHIWPRKRHESMSCNMATNDTTTPINEVPDNFRSRSKSLDVSYAHRILNDCDATYKIFDSIVREGAHMRRASAELEKRRASLGATRGLRPDGTLDPYHAAILFRDSR